MNIEMCPKCLFLFYGTLFAVGLNWAKCSFNNNQCLLETSFRMELALDSTMAPPCM